MKKYLLVASLLAALFGVFSLTANAGTLSGVSSSKVAVDAASELLQKVQYGGCRAWRHRCAERWGWGTWEFRRCLRRHDCTGGGDRDGGYREERGDNCRPIRHRCARRYDRGTPGFYHCIRRYGCGRD